MNTIDDCEARINIRKGGRNLNDKFVSCVVVSLSVQGKIPDNVGAIYKVLIVLSAAALRNLNLI